MQATNGRQTIAHHHPHSSLNASRTLDVAIFAGSDTLTAIQIPNRRKAWATKVKTGCKTCRTRRLKCDEKKPICNRCARAGRNCVSYSNISIPGRLFPVAVPDIAHPGLAPTYLLSSTREKQIFHAFLSHTLPHIASPFDRAFWTVDVPRASLSFPAIWHAGIALAAIHLQLDISGGKPTAQLGRQGNYIFSLTHYNKAVKHLVGLVKQDAMDYTSQELILMANILFTSICALLGDTKELMTHARHGLELFYEWKLWDDDKSRPNPQIGHLLTKISLVSLMNRIEGQFTRNGHSRSWHQGTLARRVSNTPFVSVIDAYLELQPLMSGLLEFQCGLSEFRTDIVYKNAADCQRPLPDACLPYRQEIKAWNKKCQNFMNLQKPEDEGTVAQEHSLKMWLMSIEVMCQPPLAKSELCWDQLQDTFEVIVELAEAMTISGTARGEVQPSTTGRCLYLPSMCEALQCVAERCRDPTLRRRAASLMILFPIKEGLWDNELLMAITKVRIEAEEGGALTNDTPMEVNCTCIADVYICHGHRIVDVLPIEFIKERTVKVSLRTPGHVITNQQGYTRILSW